MVGEYVDWGQLRALYKSEDKWWCDFLYDGYFYAGFFFVLVKKYSEIFNLVGISWIDLWGDWIYQCISDGLSS